MNSDSSYDERDGHETQVSSSIGPGELNEERQDQDRAQGGQDAENRDAAVAWFPLLLQVSKHYIFSVLVHLVILFRGCPHNTLPDSIPKIDANSAKVAYAHETLDMIQAETFMAECAYRRSISSTLPLEIHMMRKREILKRAREAFRVLCLEHNPCRPLRYALPDRNPATSFVPTSFPPNSEAGGYFTRG